MLDIGAGTWLLTAEAARRWRESTVIAADPAEAMLDVIRARLREEVRSQRITFVNRVRDQLVDDDLPTVVAWPASTRRRDIAVVPASDDLVVILLRPPVPGSRMPDCRTYSSEAADKLSGAG